jgi:hypothetical protein
MLHVRRLNQRSSLIKLYITVGREDGIKLVQDKKMLLANETYD